MRRRRSMLTPLRLIVVAAAVAWVVSGCADIVSGDTDATRCGAFFGAAGGATGFAAGSAAGVAGAGIAAGVDSA